MTALSQAGKSARERFLTAASDILLISSPTVSARLGGQHLGLAGDDGSKSTDTVQCRACGSHLIPGWSCKKVTRNSSRRTEKRKKRAGGRAMEDSKSLKSQFLQCDRCDTRTPISKSRKARQQQPGFSQAHMAQLSNVGEANNATPVTPIEAASAPTSCAIKSNAEQGSDAVRLQRPATNVSTASKKRARTKKASGLQALLAQRKADVKGPGLDLMDFMKGT